jgi:hypothetical protein
MCGRLCYSGEGDANITQSIGQIRPADQALTTGSDRALAPRWTFEASQLGTETYTFLREHRRALTIWALVAFVILISIIVSVFWLPELLVPEPPELKNLKGKEAVDSTIQLAQSRNAARANLVQAIAGIAFLFAAFFAWRQVTVTREGQQVDRFTKSVDQLGSERQDIRLGGIYALDQMSLDPKYSVAIAEIFALYIRDKQSAGRDKQAISASDGSTLPPGLRRSVVMSG